MDAYEGTYLVEVHGNESQMVLVEKAESEEEARRTAYEALFGEPKNDEEAATDETVKQHTTIHPLPIVISTPAELGLSED